MSNTDANQELVELRARCETLEQLLEVHERVALEQTARLEQANAALLESQRVQEELIEKLRINVDELSMPMLEVWDGVLVLPIIGMVDRNRATRTMEKLLETVQRTGAHHVIIDLTGVEVVDTETADCFARLAKAVSLLGARCSMTGLSPSVSQSMIALGVDLGSLTTLRTIKHALEGIVAAPDDL